MYMREAIEVFGNKYMKYSVLVNVLYPAKVWLLYDNSLLCAVVVIIGKIAATWPGCFDYHRKMYLKPVPKRIV